VTEPEPLVAGWNPATGALGDAWLNLPEEVRDAAVRTAAHTLWSLSGRQFGTHEIVLAPYLRPTGLGWYAGHRARVALNAAAAVAVNDPCGVRATVHLPGPAAEVHEVILYGEVLPDSEWVLDPDGTLVRTTGGWPVGQDVYRPIWTVRYTRGIPAPPEANIVLARFALEIARGFVGDPACRLPSRVRDITRQGISVSFEDPDKPGRTGYAPVDRWLDTVNPGSLTEPARFSAPSSRHRVIAVLS
jgi:hypothetical protein